MRALLLAIAVACGASNAFAQSERGEELRASPGGIAYGIIENANAEGVFELVHDGQVTLRHVGSGLICHFSRDGEGARVVLYQHFARGEDVSCEQRDARETISLYATRYPDRRTLDQALQEAEGAIVQRFGRVQRHRATMTLSVENMPEHRTSHFIVVQDGVRWFTSVSIAQIADWMIKLRYSALAPDDDDITAGELTAGAVFALAIAEIINPPSH